MKNNDVNEEKRTKESFPSAEVIGAELKRERNKLRYRKIIKSTLYSLIIVAAVATLIATLVFPFLQISGNSMAPSLESGDIVVLHKSTRLDRGELCAFSYSNKILIKRVIGLPGEIIEINEEGRVFVNGEELLEPYVTERALGECDIEFPFTVPEESYFVLGDQRESSIDSRSSVIGCIEKDQIVGKLFLRVWPLKKITIIE